MSREKQIEEMAKRIYGNGITHDTTFHEDCRSIARDLYDAGYRKQSEIISCKDCIYFREYSTEYLGNVEKADGDCYIRAMCSNNEQFVACCKDDYCSFAKMKGGAE